MKRARISRSVIALVLAGAMLAGGGAEAFLAQEIMEEAGVAETAVDLALSEAVEQGQAAPAFENVVEADAYVAADDAAGIAEAAQENAAETAGTAGEAAAGNAVTLEATQPGDAADVDLPEDGDSLDAVEDGASVDAAEDEEIVYDSLDDILTEDLIWTEDTAAEDAAFSENADADGADEADPQDPEANENAAAENGEEDDPAVSEEEPDVQEGDPDVQMEESVEGMELQEAAAPTSGECGDATWKLEGSTLTITPIPGKVGTAKVIYGFKDLIDSEATFPDVTCVKKIILETGIKELGYHAFIRFTKLESVSFPSSSLTRIGTGAFSICEKLENCDIPASVTQIDDAAFYCCESLTHINLSENLTSLGTYAEKGTDLYTGSGSANSDEKTGVFSGCSSLKKITIPNKVTAIGAKTFFGCSKLETVTMKGVKEIPTKTFRGCSSLTKVETSGIKNIGSEAFKNCYKLSDALFAGIETIGLEAFSGCSSLKEFSGLTSLKSIGNGAFWGCTALETVDLSYTKVEVLPESAFRECTSLVNVYLPKTLVSLRKLVFFRCKALKSINLNGVVQIWSEAFADCTSLEDIRLSDHLKTLDPGTFKNTKTAKTVTYDGTEEDFKQITNLDTNTDLTSGTVKYLKAPDKRPKASDLEKTILGTKNTDDVTDASFSVLQARMKSRGKTSIKISWEKVDGASGYLVYGALRKKAYTKLADLEAGKTSFKSKGLKSNKYYKFIVVAYEDCGHARRVERVMAVSSVVIAATKGGKYRNTDSVTIKEGSKQTLKAKKKLKLTVTEVSKPANGKKYLTYRKMTLESSNPAVAKVMKNGKIKALKKGSCYIYAYSQNGVFAKIKIKVKAA